MSTRVVHVDIQGQSYAVRSDLDPAYVSELASYVEDKMGKAATEIPTADTLRIAVLTALNLADELFRARSSGEGVESLMLARAADIERIVDSVLGGASANALAANQ